MNQILIKKEFGSNKLARIISATLSGTSMMTAFSYFTSEKKDKFFKEPELLNLLLRKLPADIKVERKSIQGWLMHYLVGFFFCWVYSQKWYNQKPVIRLVYGIPFGIVSGVMGAIIWKKTFDLHPNPPKTDYRTYYRHIFLAHLVFTSFSALGYSLPQWLVSVISEKPRKQVSGLLN
jgi:hypothetical protein